MPLVQRQNPRDAQAFSALVSNYTDMVYGTCLRILKNVADAEDATQDAMLKVLTSLHNYKPREGARFAAWVMTIAVNTARIVSGFLPAATFTRER